MNTGKLNREMLLWTALVLVLSYLCYVPMFLEKHRIPIPQALLNSKYLFITIPFLISILFTIKHKGLKEWLRVLFAEKITLQALLSSILLGGIGLSISLIYCFIAGESELFTSNYPSFIAVVTTCSYLFATALLEETAWRGFLLNRLSYAKGKGIALGYVGIIWAIWHIPMWTIRNSLRFDEILLYAIWTILISYVLGITFYRRKNIVIVSLWHMIFNTCFIAPIKYNVILLACALLLLFVIFNKKTDTV